MIEIGTIKYIEGYIDRVSNSNNRVGQLIATPTQPNSKLFFLVKRNSKFYED